MYIINNPVVEFKQDLEFLPYSCFLVYIWSQTKMRAQYSSPCC